MAPSLLLSFKPGALGQRVLGAIRGPRKHHACHVELSQGHSVCFAGDLCPPEAGFWCPVGPEGLCSEPRKEDASQSRSLCSLEGALWAFPFVLIWSGPDLRFREGKDERV